MSKILVIEDDVQLQYGLQELLTDAGYEVMIASDLPAARQILGKETAPDNQIDLYLLDIMLKGQSGFALCQEIRQTEDTPVIFLTALDEEELIIRGLNMGGDDYITKPFRSGELLARIAAHLRKTKKEEGNTARKAIQSGNIVLLSEEGRVLIDGQEVLLRKVEFELLSYFLKTNGRLLRREQILEYIWDHGENYVEDSTLTVQISRLRKKLGKYRGTEYVETVRGIGYRWGQKIQHTSYGGQQ